MPFDNQTVEEQKAWEHYKKIEAENHRLNKEVYKLRDEVSFQKHLVRVWKTRWKELGGRRRDWKEKKYKYDKTT